MAARLAEKFGWTVSHNLDANLYVTSEGGSTYMLIPAYVGSVSLVCVGKYCVRLTLLESHTEGCLGAG